MKRLLRALLFCVGFCSIAQSPFAKGEIIDSITVSGTSNESFALYLPNTYSETHLSSILFVFDPLARGKVGIFPFVTAAEEHGFMVICSNNSRNGPMENNFQIAQRLFDHVFKNFNIKENGMYLAGFSGAARLVTAIASLTDQFSGVLACGAGFSSNPNHSPSVQNYSYVGICGDEDMNYQEMLNNREYLKRLNFSSTLITFNGNHRWPPPQQIEKAFNWILLKKNQSPSSHIAKEDLMDRYRDDHAEVLSQEEAGELLFAAENYHRIIENYSVFFGLDSVKAKYKNLLGSKEYIKAEKALAQALETETVLLKKLHKRLMEDLANPAKVDYNWWRKQFAGLDEKYYGADSEMQKMLARTKFSVFAAAYEKTNPDLQQSNSAQKEVSLTIRKIIYQKAN
ncbi:hypothetical protein [Allomuricauda sp. SCSIO 65647]|uniref:hypothetical protein n=1 Tax=Allomuricauda sp. SCSIO 65647 TaxID=2908843 RepID=UPI001F3C8F33|nr:hypothetical protein [Muricauda sp. SCSIO 65647]UJH69095.1 hypothetical protein L0P89_07740 [Muricauda sp. SCSIO 65647]